MNDKYKIAVIGLGYVGLPLAKSFSKHFHTVGYDINSSLIDTLKSNKYKNLNITKNPDDIRNSKVLDIETKLTDYGYNVDIYDPLLENNNKIIKDPFKSDKKYDGIILAVSHNDFYKYTEDDFNKISKENLVLLDIKGVYSFATWKF